MDLHPLDRERSGGVAEPVDLEAAGGGTGGERKRPPRRMVSATSARHRCSLQRCPLLQEAPKRRG